VRPRLDLAPELAARFGDVRLPASDEELAAALAEADVAVWFGRNAVIPRTLAAMPRRPRTLLVIHTEKDEEIEHHSRWRHVIDACACVSPAMQRRIDGAVFIPNACSRDRLRGRGRRLFGRRGGAATEGAAKTLGFLGRLHAFKNAGWLVEHLGELDCNLALQAVDAEQTGAELAALARERGVGRRLRLLPPGPEIGTLLRSVDAIAVLSRHEAFPMVVVEAGMLEVPVIATRVGALPELFADEILFVESRDGTPDAASLRDALARLSPEWGRRLGRKVEALCSPRAVADLYAERVRALLGGAHR
jgi:glycosyltransferase involved in cell wall biosynthesis